MDPIFFLDTGGVDKRLNKTDIIYDSVNDRCVDGSNVHELSARSPGVTKGSRRLSALKRYHEVENFSNMKPGCISRELRKALSLSKYDIPLHIYRMRTLGYPPGWLRKARVEQLPSFDGESGDACNYEVRYNEDEIIEYPGFNIYSSKLRDDYHVLRCPSIQKCHLLENFIASLRGETAKSEESARRYKESLANKGLNDLEGERQRLLAEITALSNSDSSSISVFLSSHTDSSTIVMVSDEEGEVSKDDVENRSTKQKIEEKQNMPLNAKPASSGSTLAQGLVSCGRTPSESDFLSRINSTSCKSPSSEAMPGEGSVSPYLDRQEKDNKVDGGDSITEHKLSPVLEEGTTIPFNIYLIKNATADSASPVNPANVSSTSDKRPDFEAFSSGIQPYEPYVNPPNAQGAYKRVRETLKRIKDIQSCSTAVESEGDEPALKSTRSRSPVSGDNWSQEKQSSPSNYTKNHSDVMFAERGHSFRQGDRRRLAYGCQQTHVIEDHYPTGSYHRHYSHSHDKAYYHENVYHVNRGRDTTFSGSYCGSSSPRKRLNGRHHRDFHQYATTYSGHFSRHDHYFC